MFRDRTLDPVSVRTLYNHVREGRYDSVAHLTFSQQVRIEVVKIIESTPVEPTMEGGETILLGDTKELYRGYNFPSVAELEKFLADPTPFSPVYLDGPHSGEAKNPDSYLTTSETYYGLYVTLEKQKAEAYSTWSGSKSSVLLTLSWPVVRAMYVCGLLDFRTSNDAAFKTKDFSDEEGLQNIVEDVADHLPESMPDEIHAAIVGPRVSVDDLADESKEELWERVHEMPSSIIWAALYGRNREIALEESFEVGLDWKSPFGDAVIVKIDARR